MQCLSCGAQINESSSKCPHCDGITRGDTPTSTGALNTPAEATQTSLPDKTPYQAAISYPATPYQADQLGPYPPLHPYSMLPNASALRNKKKLATIIALAATAAILLFAIVVGISYNAVLSIHNAQNSDPTSLSYLQRLHMMNRAESRWNPYTKQMETLVLQDTLEDNSTALQFNYHWLDEDTDTDQADAAGCHFVNHRYHTYIDTQQSSSTVTYCLAAGTQFNNFTYQVDMTLMQGNFGGFIFRENTHSRFYVFMISSYGNYFFASNAGADSKLLARGTNPYIHQGLNQTNVLAVVALGSKLELYVNEHLITSVKDATYTSGRIGTIVIGDKKQNVDAAFSNAKVWQKP